VIFPLTSREFPLPLVERKQSNGCDVNETRLTGRTGQTGLTGSTWSLHLLHSLFEVNVLSS
jgi:hypothetical protein